MKTVSIRVLLSCVVFFVACGIAGVASAQSTRTIRVVTYNIMDDISGFSTPLAGLLNPFPGGSFTTNSSGSVTNGGVLEGIGEEMLNSNSQPIDVLLLQETTSNPITIQPIVNGLNSFYSVHNIPAGYAMSPYQATQNGGNTGGNGPNALVYNTNTIQLVASVGVGTPHGSSNGEYRQVVRYLLAPAGVTATSNNEFYAYVSHYKSGSTGSDQSARYGEALIIAGDVATLPANARILYTGDFNVSSNSEASFQTIVTTLGANDGVDPFNPTNFVPEGWDQNSMLSVKTDSATSLHYRDDFQLMTSNVYYGVAGGLAYVPGTYHTFGNNGTTPFQGSTASLNNTALKSDLNTNGVGITNLELIVYLTGASDHLPVVADYTIPVGIAPVADFTASPINGTEPLSVTFTDTSTGTAPLYLSWNLGDSTTTNTAGGAIFTHTYAAGTYTVSLTASNATGVSTLVSNNVITVLSAFQAWQINYFGSTTNPAAQASADPLGKGISNTNQFLLGLNPTNSASVFRIVSIVPQGNAMLITWTCGGGRTNVLQSTAGQPDGSYSNSFQDTSTLIVLQGSGDTTTNYLDPGAATNFPALYYRVRFQP